MIWRVRRVVTGHDSEGRSIFVSDGLAPNVKEMKPTFPGLALTDLWETKGAPEDNDRKGDAADRPVHLEPPKNGSIMRIVEFPPDSTRPQDSDSHAGFKAIGAGHAQDRKSADPMMHRTNTVDYIIVLKGEIYAIMDQGEALLRAGDILIQRGTNHSWSVRGSEPCIIAAVLINAKPLRKKASKKKPAKKTKKKK